MLTTVIQLCSAPIRKSVSAVFQDIANIGSLSTAPRNSRNRLQELLSSRGGVYKTSGRDSVFFNVYTNVEFFPVLVERGDLTVGLLLDTPPTNAARHEKQKRRFEYWRDGKHLQGGNLVVLVVMNQGTPTSFLAVLKTSTLDIARSSRQNARRIIVRASFFDSEVELMALNRQNVHASASGAFLIDTGLMYEASRPFLARLQNVQPSDIPFARYITSEHPLATVSVAPPRYATAPKFRYNLACLADSNARLVQRLDVTAPGAADIAIAQLIKHSTLDPSQVEAIVNSLTREVALIQGYVYLYVMYCHGNPDVVFSDHPVQER